MSDLSVDQTAIVKTLLSLVGRSTLPVRRARSGDPHGTAFWFDDLVSTGPGGLLVRQYLVSAESTTGFDLGELVLRPVLCDPPVNPDVPHGISPPIHTLRVRPHRLRGHCPPSELQPGGRGTVADAGGR